MINPPKMFFLDCDHTLIYNTTANFEYAWQEIFYSVKSNQSKVSYRTVCEYISEIYKLTSDSRDAGSEISMLNMIKAVRDLFGLKFRISDFDIEKIILSLGCSPKAMPEAIEFLTYLKNRKVRVAIVCNSVFSASTIDYAIKRYLGCNVEFVMTSADIALRKPVPLLLDLATIRCGIATQDIWYCGDDPVTDIEPAAKHGMIPVWYRDEVVTDEVTADVPLDDLWKIHSNKMPDEPHRRNVKIIPGCDYMPMQSYSQLISLLDLILPEERNVTVKRNYYNQ